jgi:hypothetical protein
MTFNPLVRSLVYLSLTFSLSACTAADLAGVAATFAKSAATNQEDKQGPGQPPANGQGPNGQGQQPAPVFPQGGQQPPQGGMMPPPGGQPQPGMHQPGMPPQGQPGMQPPPGGQPGMMPPTGGQPQGQPGTQPPPNGQQQPPTGTQPPPPGGQQQPGGTQPPPPPQPTSLTFFIAGTFEASQYPVKVELLPPDKSHTVATLVFNTPDQRVNATVPKAGHFLKVTTAGGAPTDKGWVEFGSFPGEIGLPLPAGSTAQAPAGPPPQQQF